MRPKFVIALLVVTGVVLAGAFYLKQHLAPVAPPPATPEVAAASVPAAAAIVVATSVAPPPAPAPAAPVPTPVPVVTLTPEQRQAAIDAEIEQLRRAGMSDNPADLTGILADLTSPEKEVREAAIQAAKQFDSTNAIPDLKAAAENTTNATEKAELLEAADFIAMPSLSSIPAAAPKTSEQVQASQQQITQWQAAKQAKLQKQQSRLRLPNSQNAASPNQGAAQPAGN